MKREFRIPAELEEKISNIVQELGYDLGSPRDLADRVLQLSDFYISNPGLSTPWKEVWAQVGYFSYFLPLNYLRNFAVVQEAKNQGFFEGLSYSVDFGAGPGTASLALNDVFGSANQLLIETSKVPSEVARKFISNFNFSSLFDQRDLKDPNKTLAVFSYSLTELPKLPAWAHECEALMIVEPSTQDDGRKLQNLRQTLIEAGFYAWAPCTHQLNCPMLLHSKKDWCHDRIFFSAPSWMTAIEKYLPMKNKTLTYSYLLMRKTNPKKANTTGRLVGDQMLEKGKTRQMYCRNDQREFLSWLHKNGAVPELFRGNLYELPKNFELISNEIRLQQNEQI